MHEGPPRGYQEESQVSLALGTAQSPPRFTAQETERESRGGSEDPRVAREDAEGDRAACALDTELSPEQQRSQCTSGCPIADRCLSFPTSRGGTDLSMIPPSGVRVFSESVVKR